MISAWAILFFSAILLLIFAVYYWLYRHFLNLYPKRPYSLIVRIGIPAISGLMLVPLVIFRTVPSLYESPLRKPFLIISYLIMGFMFFFLLGLGIVGLIEFLYHKTRPSKMDPERRKFLRKGLDLGVIAVGTLGTAVGIPRAFDLPRVMEVDVPISTLPPELDGFTIAQLTDVHLGPILGKDYCQSIVDITNSLDADLIAITGDLMDGKVDQLRDVVSPLANLRSKEGTYFVTGNHEFYSGIEQWTAHLKSLGIKVLENDGVLLRENLGGIYLSGVPDYRTSPVPSDPYQALKRNKGKVGAKVLLAHQPKSCFKAAKAGHDLMLSGHTHGGQFWPWNFIVALVQPYIEGLHKHEGMWVYVSPGTGFWGPPMRTGTKQEITLIKLRSPNKPALRRPRS